MKHEAADRAYSTHLGDKVLEAYRAVSQGFQSFGLLDYPSHWNIGDSAIWLGEIELLERLHGRRPDYVSHVRYSHVEPGRFLVGSSGVLLTKAIYRKHSGGREILVVDAAMNDLMRPALYKAWHEIVPVDTIVGEPLLTDIVGPICESGDFLALERPLAPVAGGQLLAVLGLGA